MPNHRHRPGARRHDQVVPDPRRRRQRPRRKARHLQDVRARAVDNHVRAVRQTDHIDVVARAAQKRVVPAQSAQRVVPGTTDQRVRTRRPHQRPIGNSRKDKVVGMQIRDTHTGQGQELILP